MHPLCCIVAPPGTVLEGGEGSVWLAQDNAINQQTMVESDGHTENPAEVKSLFPSSSCRISSPLHPSADQGYGKSPLLLPHHSVRTRNLTPDTSFRSSHYSGEIVEGQDALALSSISVAGILYKWVNYGKGRRPRWFILQDGVLSYYKVHGPDKILFSNDHQKSLKVIGSESQRLMKKHQNINADSSKPHKISGELHLKVSTIRESKSDEKKFSIFTGTKTLHLRASTKEDRACWLEALQTAKDLFPKDSEYNDLSLSIEERTISTEKLRHRLLNEGLSLEVVTDCEKIMLTELSEAQDQINYLQQNCRGLLERLHHLEAEKVELETTVIDETQNRGSEGYQFGNGSGSESDYNEKQNEVEAESDEDEDVFFDTQESLSSGSYRRQSCSDIGGELLGVDDASLPSSLENGHVEVANIALTDIKHPHIKRRERLPEPKEKEKSVSLWSLIKDNIGKDLTRVCLPVYFNEPISSLQKCFEDLEYSYLLDYAFEWGKRGNGLMRILNVAAFAVSGYASTEGRNCKPFNPLLGETYEADYPDKGLHFFSEKVSHHPMVIACHCEGRGWKFWGDTTVKSKFWGRSIQLDPVGVLTLEFDDGETFQWSKVTTSIYNLILGKLYVDHYGTMRITGNQEFSCKLKFKEQSIIDRNPHQVQGFIHDKSGKKLATLLGKWDESMYFVIGDVTTKPKGYDPMSEAVLIWKRNKASKFPTRHNLTSFAITLNELTPGLKEKLPPTDSRLRPDQRHLENGEYDQAFTEKLRLEQKQRQARKLQERGWQPHWFNKEKGQDTYRYKGGYWEAREEGNWSGCADIFGPEIHQE